MSSTQEKYRALQDRLRHLAGAGDASPRGVAVAFSGGVDSTLLLWAAHEALGDDALAITASSCSSPARERAEAQAFCRDGGIAQVLFDPRQMEIDAFRHNREDRCYWCKRALFERMSRIAEERGLAAVVEGANVDDAGEHRPGLVALRELSVASPLRDVGLTKREIRQLSRELGLPTWDKRSCACLATRFPYGETLDEEKLDRVDRAEQSLLDMGLRQARARVHGDVVRIEVSPEDMHRVMEDETRRAICRELKALGCTYVTLDLEGYRTGSMDERP